MNTAKAFRTDKLWILNVGDLKFLETPLEFFLALGYDFDRWPRNSIEEFLVSTAKRDFVDQAEEIADINRLYAVRDQTQPVTVD